MHIPTAYVPPHYPNYPQAKLLLQAAHFPELSERLEGAIIAMATVLTVEIFAGDVFEWAERLLGDPEISADPAAARAMVEHAQADERPHVEYLRTALSELRSRTLRSPDGKYEIPGAKVVDETLATSLRGMATERPARERGDLRSAILVRRFESLDSGWVVSHAEDEPLEILLTP